ncbi:acyltransferase family protein [Mameliella sediminis]|uniref:acyltransferase family protein n=1 Tax=Mameliella sediminis TaxID=2836866 RepID=UPI001C4485F2|nr:acyltransferase [Mameliella sediminis]MBV7393776.1 acyltransferase [Mameliella sediminis]
MTTQDAPPLAPPGAGHAGPALAADLRSLTAFRFFAAFWVFLFHVKARTGADGGLFWDIVENGARGVDFFFILSGFIILHVYERQIAEGRFSLRRFMVKRLARIYPLHLVMLLLFLALAVAGGHGHDGALASVLLVHAWAVTDGLVLNGPSWTISAEFFAYLLFGLLAVRVYPTWLLCLAFAASALAVHLFAVSLGKTAFLHLTWDFGALRILPLFVLGMILRRVAPGVSPSLALGAGLVGVLTLPVIVAQSDPGYELLLPFCLLIVAGACLSRAAWLPTNSRVMVYLGEISYSTYMIHVFVIVLCYDLLPKLGIPAPGWPIVGLVVLAGSVLGYHLVERPARDWLNRFA